jgi:HEAT repeat protein
VDPGVFVTQHLGTNAIPRLLELLSSRPGLRECCADRIAATIPALSPFLHGHPLFQTAEGRRIASWKGFGALGTNAESALPALRKMLCRPEADFLLSSTIAEIGPRGVDVLVNALTNQDDHVVSVAAFALGWLGPAANSAVPALVDLVAQGRASYQVLGALGRLGAYPELVIPALSTYLQKANELPRASSESEMAILILGLYGEQSRPVVPVLLKLYEDPDKTRRQVIRVVLKHIDPRHVQGLLGRVPNTRDDEDPWWGGTVD